MIEKFLDIRAPLVEAVRAIEASRRRIALVLTSDGKLAGTLTDGDVRRCLLSGGSLETPVSEAMNAEPLTALVGSTERHLLGIMKRGNVMAIPLIDPQGRLVDIVHISDLAPAEQESTLTTFSFAVIMAGGEGMRLRPITEKIPKPMVDIGGAPLLERQIERLAKAGFKRVYVSVNYLSHIIEEHFGDGADFGLEVRYLKEQQKMGTGGALSLLPEKPDGPIVVMNGDILTSSDFGSLNAFHSSHSAAITVAAVDYRVNIPFGVIHNSGPFVTGLAEKPSQRFLCNAGIYVLSPEVLRLLPRGNPFNMTDLIEACLGQNEPVAVYPVHEYWSDIGTPDDLDKARSFFSEQQ